MQKKPWQIQHLLIKNINKLYIIKNKELLAIQWLGLCAFTDKGPGSIQDQGTKILQAAQHSQNKLIN